MLPSAFIFHSININVDEKRVEKMKTQDYTLALEMLETNGFIEIFSDRNNGS
jgi:hypothetical protein